jgi:hypothetical protein
MLTIITPSCRQHLLPKVRESIQLDKIDKWIVVYDTSKNRAYNKIFDDPKILEVFCDTPGTCGHPQINFGVDLVDSGHIYVLDDDNIVHPNFWTLDFSDPTQFYTFDQQRNTRRILLGNRIQVGCIDTAMFVVPKHMYEPWIVNKRKADGALICSIYSKHKDHHKYIHTTAAYFNYLRQSCFAK